MSEVRRRGAGEAVLILCGGDRSRCRNIAVRIGILRDSGVSLGDLSVE